MLTIFYNQSITFAPIVSKDGSAIEKQVKFFSKFASGVAEKTNLKLAWLKSSQCKKGNEGIRQIC